MVKHLRLKVAGMLILAVYDALSLAQTAQWLTSFGSKWLPFVVLIAFVAIAFWVIYDLNHSLEQIKNARPNIALIKIENFPKPIRNIRTGEILGTPWFAQLKFANDPLSERQMVEASKVVGHISVYGQAGQHLYDMIGRWAETKEVAVGGQPIEIDSINIPANGRPYPMDIAMKYPEDEEFYGYNNDNPKLAPTDWRDRQRRLPAGTYLIRIRLRGNNVDKEFCLDLTNKGKGENVELKAVTTELSTSHKGRPET
jgi:hypothetical protein